MGGRKRAEEGLSEGGREPGGREQGREENFKGVSRGGHRPVYSIISQTIPQCGPWP